MLQICFSQFNEGIASCIIGSTVVLVQIPAGSYQRLEQIELMSPRQALGMSEFTGYKWDKPMTRNVSKHWHDKSQAHIWCDMTPEGVAPKTTLNFRNMVPFIRRLHAQTYEITDVDIDISLVLALEVSILVSLIAHCR